MEISNLYNYIKSVCKLIKRPQQDYDRQIELIKRIIKPERGPVFVHLHKLNIDIYETKGSGAYVTICCSRSFTKNEEKILNKIYPGCCISPSAIRIDIETFI